MSATTIRKIRINRKIKPETQKTPESTPNRNSEYIISQLDALKNIDSQSTNILETSKTSPQSIEKVQESRKFDRKGLAVNSVRSGVKEQKRSSYILTDDIYKDLNHINGCVKRNGKITRENTASYCPENRKCMDKKYMMWLTHNVPPLVEKLSLESYLFNGMIIPEECTAEESWELIKIRELLCVRHLMDIKGMEVKFIVSGIEWSEGSQEEENPDPDKIKKNKELTSEEKVKAEEKEANLTKYVRFSTSDDERKEEILNLFSVRTSTLKVKPAKTIGEVYVRLFEFILNNPNETMDENNKPTYVTAIPSKILERYIAKYYSNPYDDEYFKELGDYINKNPYVLQAAWDIISANGVLARVPNDVHSRKDYAHIHMAIFFTNRAYNIPADDISRQIFNKRIFLDTTVSERRNRRGRKPGSTFASAIGYALKNFKHTEAASWLGRNSCTIFNVSGDPIVSDFFSKFVTNNGIQNFIDGVNYDQDHNTNGAQSSNNFLAPLYGESGAVTSFISGKVYPKHVPTGIQDDWYLINCVREYMELNDIVLEYKSSENVGASVRVLHKIPQSKFSFETYKHGTLEILWKEVKEYYAKELTSMRKRRNVFLEYAFEPCQRWFPSIKLDYSWLEYQDFFYHIHTGSIIKEQNIYPCFRYFPDQKLDDISTIATGKLQGLVWYGILKNSGYMTERNTLTYEGKQLFIHLQQLFDRPGHKTPALCLVGPNDCGKSMLIMVLVALYPDYLIGRLNCKSKEFTFENIQGCMILLLEELRKMPREDLLMLLESGQRVLVNVKHQSAKASVVNRYNTAITSNNLDWAQIGNLVFSNQQPCLDPAIMTRVKTFPFQPLRDVDKKLRLEGIIKKELGIIMLFIGISNFKELKEITDIEELKQIAHDTRRWNYWDDTDK